MLQTTFDIRLADRDAHVLIASNREGEVAKEAELVSFAYYAAKTGDAIGQSGSRILVRFLNARRGPRVFLQVKKRGAVESGEKDAAVTALLDALLARHAQDPVAGRRFELTADLVRSMAGADRITAGNELDVALACADVAWHTFPSDVPGTNEEFRCSECGFTAPAYRFGQRLWPGEHAWIRRCPNCSNGLWVRARHRVRRIPHDIWVASEELRQELLRLRDPTVDTPGDQNSGPSLLAKLKTRFAENDWPYSEVLGLPVLVSDLAGPLGIWKFYAQVVDAHDVVLLFSVCPLRVPKERRSEASLFLTRANHGLVAGNFELDFEDGEIRYKTVLQTHDGGIDGTTLKNAIRANGLAMETYLPGIGAVITGTSARSALERRTNDH